MDKKINELLDEIKHKELVLPEFQREYDWNKSQVRKLFESLYKNYPTGSLLIWVTDNPPKIKNDAYDLEKVRRVNVLLDGQQRLTSIYIHRYGEVPPYYSAEEINDSYFDLYFNVMKGEFKYYKKLEMQNNPYWIQLKDLFNEEISAFELIEQDEELDGKEKHEAGKKIDNNITKIKNILTQDYPIQKVPSNADIKEAVKVFDLVNSQGTPLTTADIVLAHMTSQWPDIRRVLKDKIQELKEESFDFDLKLMTRCIVGVATGEGDLENFSEASEKQ
ncbi:MAG: DUF262 domain-containing protein, partial [Candidatus Magasanikbacteria bacterium]